VPEHDPEEDARLTPAGCVLTFLTIVVILGVAIPLVRTISTMEQEGGNGGRRTAILLPFAVGAVFYALGIGVLRLFGLQLWDRSERDYSALLEGNFEPRKEPRPAATLSDHQRALLTRLVHSKRGWVENVCPVLQQFGLPSERMALAEFLGLPTRGLREEWYTDR
jgi:hypothetical protein